MTAAPWWALSPNPFTLGYYCILGLYGAYKLKSQSRRRWVSNFAESAFVLGLVILSFDCFWQIFQWLKFGYLDATGILTVRNTLIRNLLCLSLCALSAWKLKEKTGLLTFKNLILVLFPVCSLLARFLLVSDPVWTDYTFGLRFEVDSPWFLSYVTGWIDKVSLALVYVSLWRH